MDTTSYDAATLASATALAGKLHQADPVVGIHLVTLPGSTAPRVLLLLLVDPDVSQHFYDHLIVSGGTVAEGLKSEQKAVLARLGFRSGEAMLSQAGRVTLMLAPADWTTALDLMAHLTFWTSGRQFIDEEYNDWVAASRTYLVYNTITGTFVPAP